jgi:uncharacterized membrane protein YciS (DUF1049 family)
MAWLIFGSMHLKSKLIIRRLNKDLNKLKKQDGETLPAEKA